MLVHQDSRHLLLITAEDPRQYTHLTNLEKKKKPLPPSWQVQTNYNLEIMSIVKSIT
jgi:hypothetical protein